MQFTEINSIFNEINFNSKKGQKYLDGNENIEEKIKLIIPLSNTSYPQIVFQLNKVKKENDKIFKEYKAILDIYRNKIKIDHFNSIILVTKEKEKEIIKTWISPTKYLKAELLFSFHVACSKKGKVFMQLDIILLIILLNMIYKKLVQLNYFIRIVIIKNQY